MQEMETLSRDEIEELAAWFEDCEGGRETAPAYYLETWLSIYRQILGEGGIRASDCGDDYREVPICVRRKNGLEIDVMADLFGYSYVDEFVAYVARAHGDWKRTDVRATPPASRAA